MTNETREGRAEAYPAWPKNEDERRRRREVDNGIRGHPDWGPAAILVLAPEIGHSTEAQRYLQMLRGTGTGPRPPHPPWRSATQIAQLSTHETERSAAAAGARVGHAMARHAGTGGAWWNRIERAGVPVYRNPIYDPLGITGMAWIEHNGREVIVASGPEGERSAGILLGHLTLDTREATAWIRFKHPGPPPREQRLFGWYQDWANEAAGRTRRRLRAEAFAAEWNAHLKS